MPASHCCSLLCTLVGPLTLSHQPSTNPRGASHSFPPTLVGPLTLSHQPSTNPRGASHSFPPTLHQPSSHPCPAVNVPQGQERKQAGAPFQGDQCDKIFRVLGHPNPRTWPLLEALPHWAKNTGRVLGHTCHASKPCCLPLLICGPDWVVLFLLYCRCSHAVVVAHEFLAPLPICLTLYHCLTCIAPCTSSLLARTLLPTGVQPCTITLLPPPPPPPPHTHTGMM